MTRKPGRDIANRRTEDVDELFYNDRLDRPNLSPSDYPARIDQAAIDYFYGISIGISKYDSGNPLAGSGTIGSFDFGRATGTYYKEGLEALSGNGSDLPQIVDDYDSEAIGELAFRLNQLQYKLEKMRTKSSDAQITNLNRVLEAVLEKAINRSMHSANESVVRQSIEDPEAVLDLMYQVFSDPSSTAYADQLIDVIQGPAKKGDILGILDSPEMVTPLWEHQREAILNWIENDCKGYVDMATATGKTVLGLAAIATLCGRLHPIDEGEIDRDQLPSLDENRRVLIVAGQELLLEQWRSEFDEHLNIPRDRTGGEERNREIILNWGTIEFKTAQELLAADAIRGYDIVILDEAHQYSKGGRSGRGWRTVFEDLVSYSDAILAMSGSVDQGWIGDEAVQTALTDNLALCKRFSVPEAREAGVIADFSWTIVYSDDPHSEAQSKLQSTTATLLEAYDDTTHKFDVARVDPSVTNDVHGPFETLTDLRSFSQSKAGGNLREKSEPFDRLATAAFSRRPQRWQLSPTPTVIAELVAAHAPEQKTIVLVQSYNQAEDVGAAISEVIGDELVLVPEADADSQFDIVQEFNDGEYQVIVGPGKVLGTGVDMPEADVAINVSKGGVNASLIQRIGRILRNPTGDKQAQFYHMVTVPGDDALILGEDGRRFVRRAAEFRALGARLRELPGYVPAVDTVVPTIAKLESAGVDSLSADHRDLDDIVDDSLAVEYLEELIELINSAESRDEPVFLAEWSNQSLSREDQPMKADSEDVPDGPTTSSTEGLFDHLGTEESDDEGNDTTSGEQPAKASVEAESESGEPEEGADAPAHELTEISGVNETRAEALQEAGYSTRDDVREATIDELGSIESIGPSFAVRIKADVGGKGTEQSSDDDTGAGDRNLDAEETVDESPTDGEEEVTTGDDGTVAVESESSSDGHSSLVKRAVLTIKNRLLGRS